MDSNQFEIIRQAVRDRYGDIAKADSPSCGCSQPSGCCGSTRPAPDQVARALGYSAKDLEGLPVGANMGLGCGNPKAIASLQPGETVLDLGSGGGFDCFLAARQVGEGGQVIGVDMTPDMVRKARENASMMGAKNVEFRLGEIEHLPVADGVVDVILSNCVINLSPEKLKVYREAFRVLKPGGRIAVSDVVAIAPLPPSVREDLAMLSACVGGAETVEGLEEILRKAGFEQIRVQPQADSRQFIKEWVPGKGIEQFIASANIQAVKGR
jgi:arsenite methyltransferase